jgi:hypothetical protein
MTRQVKKTMPNQHYETISPEVYRASFSDVIKQYVRPGACPQSSATKPHMFDPKVGHCVAIPPSNTDLIANILQ